MELSIIVPVFNVQDYVEKCILSLLDIPIKNFEIIVVDDGSMDNSINIVSNSNNEKIRILKQENKGLSAARNTGLKNAIGNYILFVDSDDYIENSFSIKSMIEIAKRKKCDIVIGNGKYFWNDEKNYYIYSMENYNRNFLINNKLFFLEGIYHEDAEWMPNVFINSSNIYFLGNEFYIYRQRDGSIINSKNNKKNFDLMKISQLVYKRLNDINDEKLKELIKERYMEIFYMAFMSGRDIDKDFFGKVDKSFFNNRCNSLKTNLKFFIVQFNSEFAYKLICLRRFIKRKLNV